MGDVAVGWCAALNGPAPYYMVMVWSDEVPLRVVTVRPGGVCSGWVMTPSGAASFYTVKVRSGLVLCGPVLYDAVSAMDMYGPVRCCWMLNSNGYVSSRPVACGVGGVLCGDLPLR